MSWCLVNGILSGLFSWPRVICSVLNHGAQPGNVRQSAWLRRPRTCQGARQQFSNWTPPRAALQRLGMVGVPGHSAQTQAEKAAKLHPANRLHTHCCLADFLHAALRMRLYENLYDLDVQHIHKYNMSMFSFLWQSKWAVLQTLFVWTKINSAPDKFCIWTNGIHLSPPFRLPILNNCKLFPF